MKKVRRIFYDLDFTLYHTTGLMADLREDLEKLGYSAEAIDAGFGQLNDVGYSMEAHLRLLGHPEEDIPYRVSKMQYHLLYGQKYLLPGVFDGLEMMSYDSEQLLLTYGFPQYQEKKFFGLGEACLWFQGKHYVWKGETKGDVITRFSPEIKTWFLDDSPAHLEDACQKAPWVKTVRIMWPDFNPKLHPGDHIRWDVVRSFDEFVALVKRGV